jgi:hypothetical protein
MRHSFLHRRCLERKAMVVCGGTGGEELIVPPRSWLPDKLARASPTSQAERTLLSRVFPFALFRTPC